MRPLTLALLTMIAISVSAVGFVMEMPSTTSYSPFNTGPNGYSFISSIVNAVPVVDIGRFNGTIIVPLSHGLSDSEMHAIAKFVLSGNKLIILDDRGYSNKLLKDYLNLSIEVAPGPILDYILNFNSTASLPLISVAVRSAILWCYFSKPSPIETIGQDVWVIGNSSSFSFEDIDNSGYFSAGDHFGPFPVIIKARIGKGIIYLVTDPDVFSNYLIGLGNNTALALFLIRDSGEAGIYLGGLNATLIDYLRAFAGSGENSIGAVIALCSLIIIAVVLFYGRKSGVFV